jgi:hypothetical protein
MIYIFSTSREYKILENQKVFRSCPKQTSGKANTKNPPTSEDEGDFLNFIPCGRKKLLLIQEK